MKNFNKDLGNMLKDIRESKGYSQQQLADKLGKTKALISYWEKGKRQISVYNLWLFTDIVGFNDFEKDQFFKNITILFNRKTLNNCGAEK